MNVVISSPRFLLLIQWKKGEKKIQSRPLVTRSEKGSTKRGIAYIIDTFREASLNKGEDIRERAFECSGIAGVQAGRVDQVEHDGLHILVRVSPVPVIALGRREDLDRTRADMCSATRRTLDEARNVCRRRRRIRCAGAESRVRGGRGRGTGQRGGRLWAWRELGGV